MKNRNLLMIGLMTLVASVASANQAAPKADAQVAAGCSAAACNKEEQAFASKLSEIQKKAFDKMTVDQKAAVQKAVKDGLTADAAVEKVMKEQNVALVGGELKIPEKK